MADTDTKFRSVVEVDGGSGPSTSDEADLSDAQKRLIDVLRNQSMPLFAILDAARDERVLEVLRNCQEQYQSLYEGKQGEDLANVAPYLVQLPKESGLLGTLVRLGWGKSWGVYLTCDKPFLEVRRHLRHFLLVQTDEGKELYFRFYDPRVVRSFFPLYTAEQISEFFGPIQRFLIESEDPESILLLGPTAGRLRQEKLSLISPVKEGQ